MGVITVCPIWCPWPAPGTSLGVVASTQHPATSTPEHRFTHSFCNASRSHTVHHTRAPKEPGLPPTCCALGAPSTQPAGPLLPHAASGRRCEPAGTCSTPAGRWQRQHSPPTAAALPCHGRPPATLWLLLPAAPAAAARHGRARQPAPLWLPRAAPGSCRAQWGGSRARSLSQRPGVHPDCLFSNQMDACSSNVLKPGTP